MVTEFEPPMDYAYPAKLPFTLTPGGGAFWVGFYMDDNDLPGTDYHREIPRPATFAVFANPDQGALASFE